MAHTHRNSTAGQCVLWPVYIYIQVLRGRRTDILVLISWKCRFRAANKLHRYSESLRSIYCTIMTDEKLLRYWRTAVTEYHV